MMGDPTYSRNYLPSVVFPAPPIQQPPGYPPGPPPNTPNIHGGAETRYLNHPMVPVGEPVDNQQSTNGLTFMHHLPRAGHPMQMQYQGEPQSHRYGSGSRAQIQSSQPLGGSPDVHNNSSEPFHPTAPAPSQSTIGDSTQGQEQHHYLNYPTGSMGEPVDDQQSTNRLSFMHHLPRAGYPMQMQYRSEAQSHGYESGARAQIQPSQPLVGNSSTSAGPGNSRYTSTDAHGPINEPFHPTVPTPSQSTIGGSTQGQEQYHYHAEPAAYPPLGHMQPYQQYPYTSPTHPIPAEAFSIPGDPASHAPPYLTGETPNGLNGNIGGAGTQQTGPTRNSRTDRRQAPYQRPTPAPRKAKPITYQGNLLLLQQRCRRQGADEGAIELLGKVFIGGVGLAPLTRLLTNAEAETKEFGIETGMIYTAFLEYSNEGGDVVPRFVCRLCHSEQTWKHHKDVLRHLRRDHFGLADVCNQWYVF